MAARLVLLVRHVAVLALFFHITTDANNPCLTENPYTQLMLTERILDLGLVASAESKQ